ncbi:MAG: YfhO family protein [Chloroflexota bacterium]
MNNIQTKHRWLKELAATATLLLLTLGFFWRTLSGDVYQPADGGDLVSFLFPIYRFAASQISQWTLPLWNPHLYGGAPFISDIQAGFLYPPNFLLFFFFPKFDYGVMQWLAVGHIFWAGLGMYILLRTLDVNRTAALFGAIAFQFSDPLLMHLGNLNLIAVLSWLPWILTTFHQALTKRSLVWVGISAMLFAIANYAGHAQSSVYLGMGVGLYTLVYTILTIPNSPTPPASGRLARLRQQLNSPLLLNAQSLCLLLLLTALFTAPILLPALELTQYTERTDFTYQEMADFSLAPTQVVGLITPSFFGRGPALHWSLWQRVELPYAGVITFILAVMAILLIPQIRHNSSQKQWVIIALAIALFGFISALGVYAILHGWLTLLIPTLDQLRAPARSLILTTFGMALLAAIGLHTLMQSSIPASIFRRVRTTFLKPGAFLLACIMTPLLYFALLLTQQDPTAFLRVSIAALALTIATGVWLSTWVLIAARQSEWMSIRIFGLAAVGLLFLELSTTGAYTDISPDLPTKGYDHPEIIEFLHRDAEIFRIDTRTDIQGIWQPDTAALHNLQDVWGIANPLLLNQWQQQWALTGGRHTRQYDMLNVKYVIVRDGTPLPEDASGNPKFELVLDAPGELSLYQNLTFIPRAWIARNVVDIYPNTFDGFLFYDNSHSNNAISPTNSGLTATEFDPLNTVFVELSSNFVPKMERSETTDVITVSHYGSNTITLQIGTTATGMLVLSEVWYPGWQATVNGEPTPVFRANGSLRAVPIPAGASTVHLWFEPPAWRRGTILFLIGFGLFLLTLGGSLIKRVPRKNKLGKNRLARAQR